MNQKDQKQQLHEEIRQKIAGFQKELEELQMLREATNELKNFKKYLLTETQHFD